MNDIEKTLRMSVGLADSSLEPSLVKAVYGFKGSNNDELCFEKGEIIVLTQTPEGGWYEGTLKGNTGWFPSNYVTHYELSPGDEASSSVSFGPSSLNQSITDGLQISDTTIEYRNMVYKDVVESEAAYINQIQATLVNFLIPLRKAHILDDIEMGLIVERFHHVCLTHRKFQESLEQLGGVSHKDQRIGGIFMEFAAPIKSSHSNYCALHPKFIHRIELKKEAISHWVRETINPPETAGSVLLASSVSNSFRRLDKYPALLQELQRYTDEAHPDRGDIQRAGFVYREMVTECLQLRRQKEMELEVMLGNVKNWPEDEDPISSLGPAIHMGPIGVQTLGFENNCDLKKDRYLVLFPQNLLLLSVSTEMTSFVYEKKLQLTKVTLPRFPDADSTRKTFEILSNGPGRYVFHFSNSDEVRRWISLMHQCKSKIQEYDHPVQIRSNAKKSQKDIENKVGERSKYWACKSLLPHSSYKSINSLNPSEDMAILQVIEAYYLSGRRQKQASSGHFESPQVIFPQEESILIETEKEGGEVHLEEKSLVDTVYSMQEEIKGIKFEIKNIVDVLKKEKKERKKVKVALEHIIMRLGGD